MPSPDPSPSAPATIPFAPNASPLPPSAPTQKDAAPEATHPAHEERDRPPLERLSASSLPEKNALVLPARLSEATLTRLILMRRMLRARGPQASPFIFSHELAQGIHTTPASIRRDLMRIGFTGSASRGYDAQELDARISRLLDAPERQQVALVGVGNLGRALLAYLPGRLHHLSIVAAFDSSPEKVGTRISGCPVYALEMLATKVWELNVAVAIVAVPATAAQTVADLLTEAGVRGIINFAPVTLSVPASVFVEHLDMTLGLEKVACFTAGRK